MQYIFEQMNRAIHQGRVKELFYYWKVSVVNKKGVLIRTSINDRLKEIARTADLKYEKGMAFPDLYKLYKTRRIHLRCKRPKHALVYYSKKLNAEGIRYALSKCPGDQTHFFFDACIEIGKRASLSFFEELLPQLISGTAASPFMGLMRGAVAGNNVPLINYLLCNYLNLEETKYCARSDLILEGGLEGAVETQDLDQIKFFLSKVEYYRFAASECAGRTGNPEIINIFLNLGKDLITDVLGGLVETGNRSYIMELYEFDPYLVTSYGNACFAAIRKGDKELVDFFWPGKEYVDGYDEGIDFAILTSIEAGNLDMLLYILKKSNRSISSRELADAEKHEQDEIVAFIKKSLLG
jgi:hypothetical protein